jgi:hypothetical protein
MKLFVEQHDDKSTAVDLLRKMISSESFFKKCRKQMIQSKIVKQ